MRLFGFLIIIASLTLGIKIFHLYQNVAIAGQGMRYSDPVFQEEIAQANTPATNPPNSVAPAKPDPTMNITSGKGLSSSKTGLVPLEIEDPEKEKQAKANQATGQGNAATNTGQATSATPPEAGTEGQSKKIEGTGLSPNQKMLANELGKKHEDLDKLQLELQQRQALIAAAEKQLINRQKSLENLDVEIKSMINNFEQEKEQARSSVLQTYNVMAPRAAAAIFDQMELPVLIGVVRNMSPRKLAQIMGLMNPAKANALTAELSKKELVVK